MREILFRGKTKEGKWIKGYYAKVKDYLTDEETSIIFHTYTTIYPHSELSSYEEVIPETVSRLLEPPTYDNYDGGKYFEGDIVELYDKFGNHHGNAIVVDENCITENGLGRWFPQDTKLAKVIGNVWDNPELVGEKYAEQYINWFGFSLKRR